MITIKRHIFLVTLLMLCSFGVFAQPDLPDAPVPFGFVELLVGAGALYGGRKAYKASRRKEEQ
jgi:hypothetical protein